MKRGFTLLELLIVIGILAILATAAVLVLNPAELLRQARDSTRVSDLASLNQALGLYVTAVATPDLDFGGDRCVNGGGTVSWFTHAAGPATTSLSGVSVSTTDRTVGGSGWIPVNFGGIAGGSPIANLPVDPTNNDTYNYSYGCDSSNLTYELNAKLESTKFTSSPDNKMNSDGGNKDDFYEVGTDPGLDL